MNNSDLHRNDHLSYLFNKRLRDLFVRGGVFVCHGRGVFRTSEKGKGCGRATCIQIQKTCRWCRLTCILIQMASSRSCTVFPGFYSWRRTCQRFRNRPFRSYAPRFRWARQACDSSACCQMSAFRSRSVRLSSSSCSPCDNVAVASARDTDSGQLWAAAAAVKLICQNTLPYCSRSRKPWIAIDKFNYWTNCCCWKQKRERSLTVWCQPSLNIMR